MKKYLFILIAIFTNNLLHSQNELYINGNDGTNPTLYVKGKVADINKPTLYVNGEIINQDGNFQNDDGRIELTGKWTNNVAGAGAKYTSTGEEKFKNTTNASVNGTMNGTGADNQFYNLKIDLNSASQDLTLNTDVNVHSSGSVVFVSDGRVTTGANTLFVRNNTSGSISGYTFPATNVTNGTTTKYIYGTLKRSLTTGTYEYPVGDASNMVPLKLTNVTAAGDISAKVANGSTAVGNSGYLYKDVATHPGSGGSGQNLSAATSNSPDGIMDQLQIDLNGDVEWQVNKTSGTVTSYDIEVFPGSGTHDVSGVYSASIGDLRYLFKDGALYDVSGTVLSNNSYPNLGFPETGYDGATPNAYSLTNLNSFSNFRIGGVSSSAGTLPVKLISLDANGVDNSYIQVTWQTATEINNKGFEIQRSIDGLSFKTIGFVQGNENTLNKQDYLYNDKYVSTNTTYYYRLKQIDFNGNFELTYKVSASISGIKNNLIVSSFIPNPSTANSHIEIQATSTGVARLVMFNGIGQLIMKQKIDLNKGLNVLPFNLANMATGVYHTTIQVGEETFTRKLSIVR